MSSSRQLAENCTVLIKNLKVGDADKVKHFVCHKTKNLSGEIALSVAKISPAFPGPSHRVRKSRVLLGCMLADIVTSDGCVCTRVHVCVRVHACVFVCARVIACVQGRAVCSSITKLLKTRIARAWRSPTFSRSSSRRATSSLLR